MYSTPSRSVPNGSVAVVATSVTPGMARSRSSIALRHDSTRSAIIACVTPGVPGGGRMREGGTRASKTRRRAGSNPRSAPPRLAKLRTSHPAPATSVIASAISATTIVFNSRCALPPAVALRPLSFISVLKLVLREPQRGRQAHEQAGHDEDAQGEQEHAHVERHAYRGAAAATRPMPGGRGRPGTPLPVRRASRRPRRPSTRSATDGRSARGPHRGRRGPPSLATARRRAPASGSSRSRRRAPATAPRRRGQRSASIRDRRRRPRQAGRISYRRFLPSMP